MKNTSNIFLQNVQLDWENLGKGVSRKILGWDSQLMMVKVKFEKGAEGTAHHHIHSQTTYCLSGRFSFSIGDENIIINPGDGLYVPPNTIHAAVCLEAGELIDAFSPFREDFLQ